MIMFERVGDFINRIIDAPDWRPAIDDETDIFATGMWTQQGGPACDSETYHTLLSGMFRIVHPDMDIQTELYVIEDICPLDESA